MSSEKKAYDYLVTIEMKWTYEITATSLPDCDKQATKLGSNLLRNIDTSISGSISSLTASGKKL